MFQNQSLTDFSKIFQETPKVNGPLVDDSVFTLALSS